MCDEGLRVKRKKGKGRERPCESWKKEKKRDKEVKKEKREEDTKFMKKKSKEIIEVT
jgi:hypothetical protein